jgi:PKD repeat protein
MKAAQLLKSVTIVAVLVFAAGSVNAQKSPDARFVPNKGASTTDNALFHFKNVSEGATKYCWITGDGVVVDNTNDLSWEFSDMGFYRVGLIAYNEAKADTTFMQVAVLRGQNNGNAILDATANKPIPALSYSEEK